MEFLIRFIVGVLAIWLAQVILGELGLKEPANKVVFFIVLIIAVLYILFGLTALPLR